MVNLPGLAPSRDWLWATLVRERLEPLTGTPEEIATELRAYADLGVSRVQVWLDPSSLAGVEAFAPVLDLLGPVRTESR